MRSKTGVAGKKGRKLGMPVPEGKGREGKRREEKRREGKGRKMST